MIIKKLFTDWKKAYGYFWIFTAISISLIASTELYHGGKLSIEDIVLLAILVGLFHIIFIGMQHAIENDNKREVENHTLTLDEFTKEYEITEEKALQLLKDGKLEGTISFKSYTLRDKTKEEIQNLK